MGWWFLFAFFCSFSKLFSYSSVSGKRIFWWAALLTGMLAPRSQEEPATAGGTEHGDSGFRCPLSGKTFSPLFQLRLCLQQRWWFRVWCSPSLAPSVTSALHTLSCLQIFKGCSTFLQCLLEMAGVREVKVLRGFFPCPIKEHVKDSFGHFLLSYTGRIGWMCFSTLWEVWTAALGLWLDLWFLFFLFACEGTTVGREEAPHLWRKQKQTADARNQQLERGDLFPSC